MEDLKADLLIAELLENPSQFFNAGRSYDLLQKYFNGFSLASLSQLLSHKNLTVRKVAIWIVSELGGQAAAVAEDVISLLKEDDRYIKYHSFESLMVLSSSGAKDLFHYVVSSLESNDDVIRKLGMYLISNASDLQLTEALKHYSEIDSHAHIEGLTFLLDTETSSRDRIGGILQGGG